MKSVDKYVYPDTNILINKFDCRDEDKLREIEALSTGGNPAYLQLHPIKVNFDFKHLKDIHHFIFQDIPLPGIGSFLFSFRFPGLPSSSFMAVGFGFLPAPIRVPSFLRILGIRKGSCSSHDPLTISSTLFTVYISDFRSAIPPTYRHTFPQLPVRTEPCTCASVLMYHGL